ncbi:MAG: hypothetical protein V4754_13210 [Pseudomonadota bacterium]
MPLTHDYAVRIAASTQGGPLSRERKRFNSLVKKLDAERARLALWRDQLPHIRALADSQFQPLAERFDTLRKQLVSVLDMAHDNKAMGKKNKAKLADLIIGIAEPLMAGDDDEAIKAIYNKYSGRDFDLDTEADHAELRAMLSEASGIELGEEVDVSSPAAFFKAFQEHLDERARTQAESAAGTGTGTGTGTDASAKPAKPSAREARHQAEQLKLKHSVRDIFRKLASALHPDRESDPAEHARKTALMQRANVAYAANDLLALLEMQLEVAQIDQAGLNNLADDRIKQYNMVLQEQVGEVGAQIAALELQLMLDLGWEPGRRLLPKTLMKSLEVDIARMRANVMHIEADLAAFADLKRLKAWLADYRIEPAMPEDAPWF